MKKKRLYIYLLIALFSFGFNIIYADTLKLTLEEAIALGIKNSNTLQQKMLAVASARASIAAAKSAQYPNVSMSVSYTHLFDQPKSPEVTFGGFTIPGSYMAPGDPISISLDANQAIYTFGKVKNAIKIAEKNLESAEIDLEEEKQKLIMNIKRAFDSYLLANEVVKINESTFKQKLETLKVAKEKYEAGISPDYEVLMAESDIENFKPVIISSNNRVKLTILVVKDLLAIKEDEGEFNIELIGSLKPEYYTFDKDELKMKAISRKYEISSYKKKMDLMKIQNDITKSTNKPTIVGFANYSLASGFDSETGKNKYFGKDSWDGNLTVGASVQMPISAFFPWSKENADIKKSEFDLEQMNLGLSTIESGIKMNIENILLKLEEEKSKIASAEKGIELANKLYESSLKQYRSGYISSLELQNAQISLNNAKLGYIQAVYNYRSANMDLMDAVGVVQF